MRIPGRNYVKKRKRKGGACASPKAYLSSSVPVRIPGPVFLICLFFFLSLLCLLRLTSRSGDDHLTRITFPKAFAEFAGYTPDEEEALWREAEDRTERYTLLERQSDDSLSLYITPTQLQYNRRLYEEGLKGWMIRCESRGIQVHPSDDYRSVRLIVDSYNAYQHAAGELQAALVAVSCLQIMYNAPDDNWHLRVSICPSSSPTMEIASWNLPGEEPCLTPEMWP